MYVYNTKMQEGVYLCLITWYSHILQVVLHWKLYIWTVWGVCQHPSNIFAVFLLFWYPSCKFTNTKHSKQHLRIQKVGLVNKWIHKTRFQATINKHIKSKQPKMQICVTLEISLVLVAIKSAKMAPKNSPRKFYF